MSFFDTPMRRTLRGALARGCVLSDPVELSAAPIPEPSVEGWDRFSNLLEMALTDRKAFEARCKFRRRLVEAHRKGASGMRKRGAQYDDAVAATREAWFAEFEVNEAIVRMQAGL
jgi:hypothetical protein